MEVRDRHRRRRSVVEPERSRWSARMSYPVHEEKGGEDVLLYARPSKCSIIVMYFPVAFSINMFLLNDHINLASVWTCDWLRLTIGTTRRGATIILILGFW